MAVSNASGVAQRRDVRERADAHLKVPVALHRGEQEAPLELAAAVEVEHRASAPPSARRDAGAGERRPEMSLVGVEMLDRDPPELALEDREPPLVLGGDGQHPALDANPAAAAAAHRPDDDRASSVDVAVEQRVQRDDRVVVLRRGIDEVDDEARLLAGMAPRHAADALLVDAPRGGRREVHADGRARAVPALGEQLRVDEDVDLAALVAREDLGELALRRLAGDRLRLQARLAERLLEVVGVAARPRRRRRRGRCRSASCRGPRRRG